MKNTELVDCTDLVNNDKSINYFNMSSISSGSDFVFKPVNNLFKSPGNLMFITKRLNNLNTY